MAYAMEEFIRAVRKHECLWNPTHKYYRELVRRESAWQKIVDLKLDVRGVRDVRTAKLEWKKLRDTHRDSLKRLRMKSSTTPNPWKHALDMEFLVPFMRVRGRSSHNTEQNNADDTECEQYSPAAMFLQSSYLSEDEESKVSVQNEIIDNARTRNANIQQPEMPSNTSSFIKEIEKVCQKRDGHPIDYFFESMAQTTKSLPIYLQNRIKKEVLEVVCQAEEEMESNKLNGYGN